MNKVWILLYRNSGLLAYPDQSELDGWPHREKRRIEDREIV